MKKNTIIVLVMIFYCSFTACYSNPSSELVIEREIQEVLAQDLLDHEIQGDEVLYVKNVEYVVIQDFDLDGNTVRLNGIFQCEDKKYKGIYNIKYEARYTKQNNQWEKDHIVLGDIFIVIPSIIASK